MTDPLFLAYLSFTLILVLTPGATTAVVVRHTLSGGRPAGFAAAFGAAVGNTSHAAAAGLGLALVVARWPVALATLRIGGAGYLGWLGLTSVYRAIVDADGSMRVLADDKDPDAAARRGSFRQGLTVNLLNPSIATFYLVVVPTFLPSEASRWHFVTLAAIHIALAFACHGLWTLGLLRLTGVFRRAAARRGLEAVTGFALLALAIRVFIQK